MTADVGRQAFGEFGCIHHSGTLDKTQVPFDLYVKVRAQHTHNRFCTAVTLVLLSVREYAVSGNQLQKSYLWIGPVRRSYTCRPPLLKFGAAD